MVRQRLRVRGSALSAVAGRVLVLLLAAALIWYGTMLVLLALKFSPQTVNELSGYRDVYDHLASVQAADISGSDRVVVAIVGLVVALAAGTLLWRGLPRPHLARGSLSLPATERGQTDVQPRALERAVEAAAGEHPAVVGARARYDDGTLALTITTRDAAGAVRTLREVRDRAHDSLTRHELDLSTVDVTLSGHEPQNRREPA
ncbi:MAG: hypothetical protein WKF42_09350 [Solirubrobacteraceae bacterium]